MAPAQAPRRPQRFLMQRCERNGPADLFRTPNLEAALRYRDEKAKEDGRPAEEVLYRVIDTEDPERGDAEWCEGCDVGGSFLSLYSPFPHCCDACEEQERRRVEAGN